MKLHLDKLLFLLAAATKSPLFAHAQVAELCESTQLYGYDSGHTKVAATEISIDNAPWIQLDLTGTELAAGSTLTIESKVSSEVITSDILAANAFSSVFDGNSVTVTLTTPGDDPSRILIPNVNVGICKKDGDEVSNESICGDVDDRVPSTDYRAGRIGGCTGWLISEDVFIQAGHCGTPSSSTRIHFTFGRSSAPTNDQYAVDVSSYQGVNGGVGNDWGVGRLLPNSSTGKLPGVAQSEKCGTADCGWYQLGDIPSTTTGNNIRVTGYGTAAVDSRSQKTHVGPLASIGSTSLRYRPDTTGGNSGSPVIHEETGKAIGVHTHGGCSATGGSNAGTRIDKPDFAAKIASLLAPSPPTSQPTPMPTNEGDSGPQSAAYDASFDAPKCSFGSSCDSQGLLDGRGNISGGNEPNQPNTLNSCTDGSSGSYHSDESVDKIVVSQAPGITSDMTVGDTVTITATVWCWSNGASDYIDFYYASDATNPVWVQIGERQQCPGGGEQTVTAEYILPEGEIQGVRVNLMYQSSTASADSCTTGGYDDTDDLVISVKSTSGPTPPPSSSPTQSPTTAQPSSPPSNNPTQNPTTSSPTSSPTANPSSPPTSSPSQSPTQNPTTSSPTSLPTANPSSSPTSSPSQSPTNKPTAAPSSSPSSSPSKSPTSSPTTASPTTSLPTKAPVAITTSPSSNPTEAPTSFPTNSPTTASPSAVKTLVCGRGDITSKPCAEGLERTAATDTVHEVRCCRDCEGLNCKKPWKSKCPDFDSNLWARTKYAGTCKRGTFAEAIDFCRNMPGENTRLCTPDEVKNSCTKGTGCNFDREQIWSCAYDGHVCSSDEDCCGTCNSSGVCEDEFVLYPRESASSSVEYESTIFS